MIRPSIHAALAATTLALLPAAAFAQTNTMATKPAPAVTKPKAAQSGTPAMKTGTTPPAATSAKMATAKTKSGKTITYDCSKKGNMTKKACKG